MCLSPPCGCASSGAQPRSSRTDLPFLKGTKAIFRGSLNQLGSSKDTGGHGALKTVKQVKCVGFEAKRQLTISIKWEHSVLFLTLQGT